MYYLKEQAIRINKKKVYFFDSEGIYTESSVENARKMHLKGLKSDYYKLGEYRSEMDFSGPTARAILCLEVGDSIKKLEQDIKEFEVTEKEAEKMQNLINRVLRIRSKKFYFFNEQEEWTCLSEKEILSVSKVSLPRIWFKNGKDISYEPEYISYELLEMFKIDNRTLLRKAISMLEPGDSIEKLKEYCNGSVTLKEKSKRNTVQEGIVTKICNPKFVCKPENPNKKTTFDYINVDVNLLTTWEGDKKEYIEKHKEGISKIVLEKIKNNKTFIKYKIPVNCLKIASITLYKDKNVLQYVLEINTIE